MAYQGIICLAGYQVWWTWECEDTFNKMKRGKNKSGMKDFAKKQHRQIDELVVKVREHVQTYQAYNGNSGNEDLLQSFFPGLFFYVYIESPNPKKPRRPHTTGTKPYQLKSLPPKNQSETQTPKPQPQEYHKQAKIRKKV